MHLMPYRRSSYKLEAKSLEYLLLSFLHQPLHNLEEQSYLEFPEKVNSEKTSVKGQSRERLEKLDQAMDAIKKRYGDGAIMRGSLLLKEKQPPSAQEE